MSQEATAFPSTVLVVDDEPVVLELFSRLLAEKGTPTRTASTADEALRLVEDEGFACLLADKNLPGMDGIELVRKVRKTQPHCACIIMTGYASMESAVEALRLGAVDYLLKPFEDVDLIAQRIEDAIRAVRIEFERQTVLARLGFFRDFHAENDGETDEPRTEGAAPVELLEARVLKATADLRGRCLHLLSRLVATKSAGRDVLLSGERIVDDVRRAQLRRPNEDLASIEAMLEEHLALARHAQSR
jgi:CheY-like chemotaxis protein